MFTTHSAPLNICPAKWFAIHFYGADVMGVLHKIFMNSLIPECSYCVCKVGTGVMSVWILSKHLHRGHVAGKL